MAQVPTLGAPQVSPNTSPTPFADVRPAPEAFLGTALGQGAAQLGQTTEHVSDALQQHAAQFQQLNNQQASDSAAVAANSHIDNMVRDYLVNNPGMAAYQNLPTFYKQLEETRGSFGQNLPLPAKVEYDSATRRWLGSAFATVSSQAAEMRRVSIDGTAKATSQQWIDKAASDPTQVDGAVAAIGTQANTLTALHGWTPAQTEQYIRENVGSIYYGQAKRAIDGSDYEGAKAIVTKYGSQMTQQQIDSVLGPLRTLGHANDVANAANKFLDGGHYGASGDATLADIKPLENSGSSAVSPKGAVGTYQIMPVTAQQYGLDPTRLKDPAYNEYAAGVILDDIHKRFPGDGAAQLAAWNAGPGRAHDWRADDRELPGETQAYVGRSRFASSQSFAGQGAITNSMNVEAYIGNAVTGALQAAPSLYPNNSVAQEQFVQQVEKAARLRTAGVVANQKATYENLDQLVANGTVESVNDFQQKYAGQWDSLPAQMKTSLARSVGFYGNMHTDERDNQYLTLRGQYANAAAGLDNSFTGLNLLDGQKYDLTRSQRTELVQLQQKLQAKGAAAGAVETTFGQAMKSPQVLQAIDSQGLTDRHSDEYHAFQGALYGQIEAYQQQHGAPPKVGSPEFNNIVAQVSASKPGGWFGLGRTPAYQVPDAERQAIITAYQKQYPGQTPPEYEISRLYGIRQGLTNGR